MTRNASTCVWQGTPSNPSPLGPCLCLCVLFNTVADYRGGLVSGVDWYYSELLLIKPCQSVLIRGVALFQGTLGTCQSLMIRGVALFQGGGFVLTMLRLYKWSNLIGQLQVHFLLIHLNLNIY